MLRPLGRGGEEDIRLHPAQLGAAATDAVELRHGQSQPPQVLAIARHVAVEIDQGLDRALAEGRLADDDGPAIVLHGGGEDLRGGGAVAVHQHGQGPGVGGARGGVLLHVHLAEGVLDLDHRALIDEQPGEVRRLGQGAAAVTAQVHQDPIHPLALEVVDQVLHVPGGAAKILVAIGLRPEVAIKARHLQDPDAQPRGIGQVVHHVSLGRLILQLDLVAHQGDFPGGTIGTGGLGQDLQPHHRVLGPADLVHHVLEAPAHHVLDGPVLALANPDDAVAGMDQARHPRRAPGNGALHLGVVRLALEHRADAFQGQAHADIEVLRRAGRHVAGVRLQGLDVGVDEGLIDVIAIELPHPLRQALVTLPQDLADLLVLLLGQLEAQPVVLHPLAPDLIQFRRRGRPGGLGAIEAVVLVLVETEALVQQGQGEGGALFHPLAIEAEDLEAQLDLAPLEIVIQLPGLPFEAVHLALGEEGAVGVQGLEIGGHDAVGEGIVQVHLTIVKPFQDFVDDLGGLLLAGLRLQIPNRHLLGAGPHAAARDDQQGGEDETEQEARGVTHARALLGLSHIKKLKLRSTKEMG